MHYDTNEIDYIANSLDFYNIAETLHNYEGRQFYRFANKLFVMDRRSLYFFVKANIGLFNEEQLKVIRDFYPDKNI